MYISGGGDQISCKLFPGTLRGVAMQWMATLPPRSIRTFNDLARLFLSQFAANKTKKLEVADLFDFKQARGESLKGYLARFNTATVRVNDPDQKFFVKAFQKGLRAEPVKQAKHQFTPLTERRAQILKEICHTRLLKFPQEPEGKVLGRHKSEWCDFHRTHGHSTEACWTLRTQIEQLVQDGRLNRFIHKQIPENPRRGAEDDSRNQRKSSRDNEGANITPLGRRRSVPVVTFDDRDLKLGPPMQDEPMVISVVAAEYKVERVLVDQGSSANILYWSTFRKMGLQHLSESQGALYGFAGECVPIRGTIELNTAFGEGAMVKIMPVLYTVIDADASYNIIIGRPALNRLEAVVSTYHLCMKFPVGRKICSIWADSKLARRCYEDSLKIGNSPSAPTVNVLDLDLDPRCIYETERPHPAEDVKNIQIGPSALQTTKVGTTLSSDEEAQLVNFLRQNIDVFAWTP
ncbi:hypothetical protein CR513_46428, partial [Mucuna pruriens]